MHYEACNALGALKHFDHVVNVPPRRLKQFMFVCGCRPVYIAPRGAAVSGADSGQHVMRMLSCTTITCRRTAGRCWLGMVEAPELAHCCIRLCHPDENVVRSRRRSYEKNRLWFTSNMSKLTRNQFILVKLYWSGGCRLKSYALSLLTL